MYSATHARVCVCVRDEIVALLIVKASCRILLDFYFSLFCRRVIVFVQRQPIEIGSGQP